MNGEDNTVQTTSRIAQWRIENLGSCSTCRKSDPFKMGHWNWYLSVWKSQRVHIKLVPEISKQSGEEPPIASFIIRMLCCTGNRKVHVCPEIINWKQKIRGEFEWLVETSYEGNIIIDVEFLDLKIIPPKGGAPCSIWAADETMITQSNSMALACLGRMLRESIHTDFMIQTLDGSKIGVHRAVLAVRSPIFHTMFSHSFRDNELSTVTIIDMTSQECQAFLNYIYGDIQKDEFMKHRLALLQAADKYGISDLKEACEESFLEDIDSNNVLERLQEANLYQLQKLKVRCIKFLVNFGRVFDIRDDFNAFLLSADRNLINEVIQEILNDRKGY